MGCTDLCVLLYGGCSKAMANRRSMSIGGALFVAAVFAFLYVPIVVLIVFSFNSEPFPAPWASFSLMWYEELFVSKPIWSAFCNSMIVALAAMALSLVMSLALVYWSMFNRAVRRLVSLFYANVGIPEILLGVGLLGFFSYAHIPLGLLTLIVAHSVLALGYAVPLVYAKFLSIEGSIIESSYDLGATTTQTFWKIVVPLIRPAMLVSALLVFVISFDDFIVSFFCAGSESQTLSLYIYSMIRSGLSPVVNALSTILLVMSSLLVILFCSLSSKIRIF